MAKLEITSTTTVKELAQEFKKEFGATLRIYNGRSEADSDATLVSLGAKTGIVECRANRTVGSFVEMMQKDFNLKVKVRTTDDWVTVIDGLTLNRINELPKQPTQTQMEDFVSYQRKDTEEIDKNSKQSKEGSEKEDLNNNLDNKFESVQEGYIASQEFAKSLDGLNYALHKKNDGYYDSQDNNKWFFTDLYVVISNGKLVTIASDLIMMYQNIKQKGIEENNCDFYYTNIKGEYFNTLTAQIINLPNAPWRSLQDDTVESIINSFNGDKDKYPPIPVRFIYNGDIIAEFILGNNNYGHEEIEKEEATWKKIHELTPAEFISFDFEENNEENLEDFLDSVDYINSYWIIFSNGDEYYAMVNEEKEEIEDFLSENPDYFIKYYTEDYDIDESINPIIWDMYQNIEIWGSDQYDLYQAICMAINGEDTSDFPHFKFQLTSDGEVFYEGELG